MGNAMDIYEYGSATSDIVLIQPVDDHDLNMIKNEYAEIKRTTGVDFRLIAVKISDWNTELSPWEAPAVFGKENFGSGAQKTLSEILPLCADKAKTYYIGGYSLAGLFALWSAYQTDTFEGVAAASPSVWFPGFIDFMKINEINSKKIYLSLGDKEPKARNPLMATVADKIKEAQALLSKKNDCILEWNEGNHFKDADLRTAKAFAWLIGSKN